MGSIDDGSPGDDLYDKEIPIYGAEFAAPAYGCLLPMKINMNSM